MILLLDKIKIKVYIYTKFVIQLMICVENLIEQIKS